MNQTVIQAKTTKTSTFDGDAVDVSALPYDRWTLILEIFDLTGTARLEFACSQDAFDADALAGPTFSFKSGRAGAGGPVQRYTVTERDFPSLRVGVAYAELRLSVTALSVPVGETATITYGARIEYGS